MEGLLGKQAERVASALIDLPGKYAKAGARPADQVPAVLDAMTRKLLLDRIPNLEEAILDPSPLRPRRP